MSKGGAFVHDPKLAKESEVKARVKLQFRDRAGNKTVVSRMLQAVQKVRLYLTMTQTHPTCLLYTSDAADE